MAEPRGGGMQGPRWREWSKAVRPSAERDEANQPAQHGMGSICAGASRRAPEAGQISAARRAVASGSSLAPELNLLDEANWSDGGRGGVGDQIKQRENFLRNQTVTHPVDGRKIDGLEAVVGALAEVEGRNLSYDAMALEKAQLAINRPEAVGGRSRLGSLAVSSVQVIQVNDTHKSACHTLSLRRSLRALRCYSE